MALAPELYAVASSLPPYSEADDVMIHYTVTETCAFNCRGCINALTAGRPGKDRHRLSSGDPGGEENLERDVAGIADLIARSGKEEAVIVFYGGEPMLRLDRMNRVYESLNRAMCPAHRRRYAVITSGHYLEKAMRRYPALAADLWLTAVSIDGTERQHEAMRRGTSFKTIHRNLAAFSRIRKGEVVIWSTLRPGMSLLDCFDAFMALRGQGYAEHFFWHCDESEGLIPELPGYLDRYRRETNEIMQAYVACLERGELLSIVHVNELLLYLLTGKRRGTTACGVERMENFDIIGDGKVHACADIPEIMSIGRIDEDGKVVLEPDVRERLARIVTYKRDLGCDACGIEPYCGGRCPVQANTGGIGRARQYCFMMREHVRTVKDHAGRIVELLASKGLSLKDLYRSARHAKYTDVTP
jgi:radical SAM protein with 4Fe4S-binding SPASM domain